MKKGAVKDQTTMGYIAVIDKIHPILIARKTPPWLDFILQYTYPQLKVDFGSSAKFSDQRPDSCLGDKNAISDMILNSVLSFSKTFAYQLNKANCMSLYGQDYVFDKTPGDFNEKKTKHLITINGKPPSFGFDTKTFNEQTFMGKRIYMKAYVAGKYKDGMKKITNQSPIFLALEDFKSAFEDDNGFSEKLKTLISMFNPCSFKDFLLTLIKCMFRGMSMKEVYMAVIKGTLGNIAAEGLEIVLSGLPAGWWIRTTKHQ